MYALVTDGEYQGLVSPQTVRRALNEAQKVEVARFAPELGWVPVCLEVFN